MGKYFIFKVNTSMNYRLQKPYFCKINDIKPGRHCYNVYCRVVKVNSSEITKFNGEVIRIADGVVGDETGVANLDLLEKMLIELRKELLSLLEMEDLKLLMNILDWKSINSEKFQMKTKQLIRLRMTTIFLLMHISKKKENN